MAELHDEEDEDVSNVKPFDFDESKFRTTEDVKAAIYDETVAFHRKFPSTAPRSLAVANLEPTGGDDRAASGTLDRQVVEDTEF